MSLSVLAGATHLPRETPAGCRMVLVQAWMLAGEPRRHSGDGREERQAHREDVPLSAGPFFNCLSFCSLRTVLTPHTLLYPSIPCVLILSSQPDRIQGPASPASTQSDRERTGCSLNYLVKGLSPSPPWSQLRPSKPRAPHRALLRPRRHIVGQAPGLVSQGKPEKSTYHHKASTVLGKHWASSDWGKSWRHPEK